LSLRQRLAALIGGEKRTLENPLTPLTAEQLVSYLDLAPAQSGVNVTAIRAANQATVISCVKILAETLAMLPLKTYERLQPRGRAVAFQHPTYTLLHDRANPELPAFIFREVMQAHLGLWGNAYAEIETTRAGKIIALWPIAPWKVEVRRENAEKYYIVSLNNGSRVALGADRVMHVPGFDYRDGLQGISPIASMREAIGLAIATETFGAKWFGSGARPGGIITRPKEVPALSVPAAKAFKESWEQAHSGLSNAQRVAILEEGMQWQQTGIPPDDSQFLETRLFQKREIAGWYRVPLHMLADLERATFSNIEQQGIDFVTHTMGPWLSRWEAVVNYDLFSEADRATYYAEFLVTALLRGDQAARAAYYTQRFNVGSISPNDIRELENENPIEGGDRYFVQGAYVPLDKIDAFLDRKAAQPTTPTDPSKSPQANAARALFRDIGERMARRQVEQLKKAHKKGESEWRTALDTHLTDHKSAISRAISPALEAFFGAGGAELAMQFAELEIAEHRNDLTMNGYSAVAATLSAWETPQTEAFTDRALRFVSDFMARRAA
jgi:HK97 family phage portal protein